MLFKVNARLISSRLMECRCCISSGGRACQILTWPCRRAVLFPGPCHGRNSPLLQGEHPTLRGLGNAIPAVCQLLTASCACAETAQLGIDPHTWEGRLVRSKDSGRSWGPIEALPSGLFGPVKNKPVVLDDGTIISGSSDEVKPDSQITGLTLGSVNSALFGVLSTLRVLILQLDWSVHIEYSKDNGYTWHKGNKLRFQVSQSSTVYSRLCFASGKRRTGSIQWPNHSCLQGKILQPALFVNSDKTLGMLCRSNGPRINKRFVDNNAVLSISDRCRLSDTRIGVRVT